MDQILKSLQVVRDQSLLFWWAASNIFFPKAYYAYVSSVKDAICFQISCNSQWCNAIFNQQSLTLLNPFSIYICDHWKIWTYLGCNWWKVGDVQVGIYREEKLIWFFLFFIFFCVNQVFQLSGQIVRLQSSTNVRRWA